MLDNLNIDEAKSELEGRKERADDAVSAIEEKVSELEGIRGNLENADQFCQSISNN